MDVKNLKLHRRALECWLRNNHKEMNFIVRPSLVFLIACLLYFHISAAFFARSRQPSKRHEKGKTIERDLKLHVLSSSFMLHNADEASLFYLSNASSRATFVKTWKPFIMQTTETTTRKADSWDGVKKEISHFTALRWIDPGDRDEICFQSARSAGE